MTGPNYKRFPHWDLLLNFNFRAIRITPVTFLDDELVEGLRVKTKGIAWLFVIITFEQSEKVHDAKAGFLH